MENLVINKRLFQGVYEKKKVLITGNSGFKGSWLSYWLHLMGADVYGISLRSVSNPSHFQLLKPPVNTFYQNISNFKRIKEYINQINPDIIFHLAAQSLVMDSFIKPILTYKTNVMGTMNILESAKSCSNLKVFINITSDKVYENNDQLREYEENDSLGGDDLYSSSKACSEILTSSFKKSFQNKIAWNIATVRAGNVIGGGDWSKDRLIPDVIKAIDKNKKVKIRNPHSIRPWQHVLEPLTGYLILGQKMFEPGKKYNCAWNFGPEKECCIPVKKVLDKIQIHWNSFDIEILKQSNEFPEKQFLTINSSKAKEILCWNPVWDIDKAVEKTIMWYKNYYQNNFLSTFNDLVEYIEDATRYKLPWTINF